ncbi:hypothetical protein BH10PSE7_BH10PSE7_24140 [soil metagenome]
MRLGRGNSTDRVEISDPNSNFPCGGLLTIGDNGDGFFTVDFGAAAEAGRVVMAARHSSGNASFLNVTHNDEGQFSTFTCDTLDIGVKGKAAVSIRGGGILDTDSVRMGIGHGSDGIIQLSGSATGLTSYRSPLNAPANSSAPARA